MVRAPTMLLGVILAVAHGSVAAPPASRIDKAKVDAALSRLVDSGALVGVSALVYEGGREAYFGAFGQADREARRPMARDALVQIFSMTKPITGVALMSLYEAGMFQLDDPLSKYCPEFANLRVYAGIDTHGEVRYEPLRRALTIRDITRHTAGFYAGADHMPVGEIYRAGDPTNPANTLAAEAKKLGSLPLLFQPGSRWLYGPSVDVQAFLVERLSGMPFDKYLEQKIFKPLGMKSTRYVLQAQDRPRIAAMYDWHEDGTLSREPDDAAFEFNSRDWPLKPGSYGLISTLDDYMRFARMLQNGGELDGKRILKPETVQLMATDAMPAEVTDKSWLPSKGQVGFGIDFAVRVRPPADAEEASGAVGEFFWDGAADTLFWVDPKNKITAVLFTQYRPFGKVPLHKAFRDAVYSAFPEALAGSRALPATPASIGIFDGHADVGAVMHPGTASYDPGTQEYSISGSGANMWADKDEFHYLWKRMRGDFILTARMHLLGTAVEPHRKIGWTVRPSLDTGSAHVVAVTHGNGLTDLQYRPTAGAKTEEQTSVIQGADVLQLERRGSTYTMSVARFGQPFTVEKSVEVALGDAVYVGLFVCAHAGDLTEKAVFSDVRITVPAKADFVPYSDYIGSDIEILDVATGRRRVIYHSPDSLQAPNWTRDGKALIYNSKGRLYRLDLAAKAPVEINTDFATTNNNDHVLSFDGKMLGISHQGENNISLVYTLPVNGGKPKKITLRGPSYLHSWSPDARFLLYTGGRNGNFDIYKIPSGGGEEIRLTDAPGLEDGPEYTPDGSVIFFNSTVSGLMQLWRMKPDGSGKERVTHSDTNDWFAHISPDGTLIVYLSFLSDIKPEEHPFYRQVYLRLMPIGGEPSKVIAYVYGGQGTINTPSWSPDSKRVAFVSNSDED